MDVCVCVSTCLEFDALSLLEVLQLTCLGTQLCLAPLQWQMHTDRHTDTHVWLQRGACFCGTMSPFFSTIQK